MSPGDKQGRDEPLRIGAVFRAAIGVTFYLHSPTRLSGILRTVSVCLSVATLCTQLPACTDGCNFISASIILCFPGSVKFYGFNFFSNTSSFSFLFF